MADLILYICGTVCRKTGTAGVGTIAYIDNDIILMEKGEYVGKISHNEASYLALNKALEKAVNWNYGEIDLKTDNELMYKQLKGVFDVRDHKLKRLYERAVSLLEINPGIRLGLVERDENLHAYGLAKQAANPDARHDTPLAVLEQHDSPLTWKVIAFTPKLMLVEFVYPKGTIIESHKHFHEQASYVVKGKLKYMIADQEVIMTKGMGLAINSYSEHQVEALTDSKEIVSYYPMRFDLLPQKKEGLNSLPDVNVQTTLFG